ncbi:MAG TPA: hypothetical protein VFV30_00190 [Novosphingobium sp.]|nr:hypothetical protein [Novosphingobium sp.]
MRTFAIALCAASAALLAGPAIEAKPKLTPQQELEKMLEGREPGKPTSCISSFDTREMRVLDKTAIVYGWGNTIWVNRPKNAEHLDDDEIMVIRTNGSQLCSLDIVHTVDRTGGFTTGFISLGEFVPYRKTPKVSAAD